MSNAAPWDNIKVSEDGLQETKRKFFNTIVNVYSFFAMYANIDGFTYDGHSICPNERPEMDQWIISRLNTRITKVAANLEDYESVQATRQIETFVQELSNWYVRRSRRRFWEKGRSSDKTAAYQTLYECLVNLSQLISPVAPFMGEWLYQRLSEVTGQGEESVHLSFYPVFEETAIVKSLERWMILSNKSYTMTLSFRI